MRRVNLTYALSDNPLDHYRLRHQPLELLYAYALKKIQSFKAIEDGKKETTDIRDDKDIKKIPIPARR